MMDQWGIESASIALYRITLRSRTVGSMDPQGVDDGSVGHRVGLHCALFLPGTGSASKLKREGRATPPCAQPWGASDPLGIG
jgi:hypothetical protein